MQIQTKMRNIGYRTIILDTSIIKTIDTTAVAINQIIFITKIAIYQTSIKTETAQKNNHVDIVKEQITGPGIVKPALTAEDWNICLANAENHDRIRAIDNEIRMFTKTREITIKSATPIPDSNKIL